MSNIAIARDQKILLVRETTRGVLAYPATDGSAVVTIAAGYGSMNQNPNFTDSDEVRNSRDVLDRFVDARPAGSWSFPAYIRPSGAAGTAPQDDVLYESFFGAKTVNAGVSVAYSQQLEKPSFSMWFMQDHILRFAKGCTVNSLSLTLNNTGGVTQDWSGGLMWMGWCGTDTVKSDVVETPDNKFITNNPKRFEVGARIYNVTAEDDNTGAGYEITAIDYTTGEITLGTALTAAWSADDEIAPFLPAAVEVGEPLASRLTTIDFGDDTSKRIQTMNITLNDPVQYIEDELSSDGCPTEYMEQVRDYSGTVNLYLRRADVKYFYEGFNDTELAVAIKFGKVAGKKATLNMPQVAIEVPKVTANAPAINMAIGIKALGNTGEDSATLTFA
jgi:hypothetical protein